jgi:hypothetical protein
MTRRPLLTPPQRATLLSLCTAVYGLAAGIASHPLWLRPAAPDQRPGYMKSIGIDAHSSLYFFAALVGLTLAAAYLMRPIVNVLTKPDTRAWARNGAALAMLEALWYASTSRAVGWTVVPPAIAIAVFVLLRRVAMRFSKRDAILLASFAPAFLALVDCTTLSVEQSLVVAAGSVLALRLALGLVRRGRALDAPLCFALSPVALMLESHMLSRDQRHAGWPALLVIFVTPILMRALIGNAAVTRRRLRNVIAFGVYPLAAYGYVSAAGLLAAEGKPRVSFFEEMQHVTPANAMLHGAKPYVDVVPPHGLIQDALLDYAILKSGPKTIGNVMRVRLTLNATLAIVTYALAAEATGSPDVGFLGFGAAAILGQAGGFVRFAPALVCLLIAVSALRRRRPRRLAAAGAMIVIATLTSIDFGAYAFAVTLFAALRFESKRSALIWAAIGAAVAGAFASIFMMIGGYFVAFFRVTLTEVLRVGDAYVLTPFDPTPALGRRFPEALTAVFDGPSIAYMGWVAALLLIAVVLARGVRPRGRRRATFDALLTIAFYMLVVGLSYAERHHLYFQFVLGPFAAAAAYRLWHSRSTIARIAAPAIALTLIIAANVTTHFAIVGWLRRARGPIEPIWREVDMPRARGALFREPDIATLNSITHFMNSHLAPGETFFDFTNRGLVYFLLDRELPVRQLEVAYYERDDLQREVIDRIHWNPRVKYAIVPAPSGDQSGVDLIPNETRAPLVWHYLQEHYEPDFQEGPVVIWRRKVESAQ